MTSKKFKFIDIPFWQQVIVSLLVAIGGWAVFSLTRLGVANFLISRGIESESKQLIIIIAAVILLLSMIYGVKKAIQKIA